MRADGTPPGAASWSPIDTGTWYEAREAVAELRDVFIAAGLTEDFPYLRADVNAFGHGFPGLLVAGPRYDC